MVLCIRAYDEEGKELGYLSTTASFILELWRELIQATIVYVAEKQLGNNPFDTKKRLQTWINPKYVTNLQCMQQHCFDCQGSKEVPICFGNIPPIAGSDMTKLNIEGLHTLLSKNFSSWTKMECQEIAQWMQTIEHLSPLKSELYQKFRNLFQRASSVQVII